MAVRTKIGKIDAFDTPFSPTPTIPQTNVQRAIEAAASIASGISTAEFLVAVASGSLSAERVATNTPTISWDFTTPGQGKANVLEVPGIAGNGLVARTGAAAYTARTLTAPAAGITVSNGDGVAGNPTLALANDLAALEALAGTGFAAHTGANTWAERTLTAPAAGLTISNPAGIAGNPTFALANDLAALEGLGSTGLAVRSATDTWIQRAIAGTANEITATNGDGVAANPTLSLPAALTFTGKTVTGGTFAGISLSGTTSLANGHVFNWNVGDVTLTHSADTLTFAGASSGYLFDAVNIITGSASGFEGLRVVGTDAGATFGPSITLDRNSASPAASDLLGQLTFRGRDSAGNATDYGNILVQADVVTNGSESGRMLFGLSNGAGTLTNYLGVVPGFFFPVANDGVALGGGGNQWSDLFLAPGGVVNFNNGNYTITHSAGLLTTNGALSIGTGNALTCGTIEIGAASDTTISRDSAGVIAIEGVPLYSNVPQNSKSTAYTTVLADAQKHILHPTADNNARTFTIDSNANVAYPIGTAITFVNQINTVTIAITSDTLTLQGTGATGSRTLAANGVATALKVETTKWVISGTGIT